MSPEHSLAGPDWLLVGFCGGCDERLQALSLCRRFGAKVLFREGDVMVVEIKGRPDAIDAFARELPGHCVTHLWRRGKPAAVEYAASGPQPNFCGV